MSNDALLVALQEEFAPLLASAGILGPGAQQGVVARAITSGYGDIGALESGPALTASQQADLTPLAEFYILQTILRAVAVQVDSTTADQKEANSQRYKQVLGLFTDAKQMIQARGYGTVDLMQIGRLNLDFLEPTR